MKSRLRMIVLGVLAGPVCLLIVATHSAVADTYTFKDVSGGWLVEANWDPAGGPPGAGDTGTVAQGRCDVQSGTTFAGTLVIATGGSLGVTSGTADDLRLDGGSFLRWGSTGGRTLAGAIRVDSTSYLRLGTAETKVEIISATLSGSGDLVFPSEHAGVNGGYSFYGDNSGYSGNWTLDGGYVQFHSDTAAGTGAINVDGGWIHVGAGVTLTNTVTLTSGTYNLGLRDNNTATLTDLRLNGGQVYRQSSSYARLAGSINVTANGSSFFNGSDAYTVLATLAGGYDLEKTGSGPVTLSADNSGYTGNWTVSEGLLQVAHTNGLGTGNLTIAAGAIARLDLAQDWTLSNSIAGLGVLEVGKVGSSYRRHNIFTLKGGILAPGGASEAGVLTIRNAEYGNGYDTDLTFARNGDTCATVEIHVVGGGAVAGTDYDQVSLTDGDLTGLADAELVVHIDPSLKSADLSGDVLTILTCNNDTGDQQFDNVSFDGGWQGAVNYEAGAVTLSNLNLPIKGTILTIR